MTDPKTGGFDGPRLLFVNLATERTVRYGGRDVRTGIYKEPANGRVRLRALGLEGDFQADPSVHGGPEKAAYVYPSEHYPYFRELLKRPDLSPGFFGENFTTEGLVEDGVRSGDVFRVGTAVVQVTSPRTPCFKLAARAGSPAFVGQFLNSRRLGFYLSVLEEGDVAAGDPIRVVETSAARPTLARWIDQRYFSSR
jgi:MOSC domain-containing protein YiiM